MALALLVLVTNKGNIMKQFIAIVKNTDLKVDKYQDFDTQKEADAHALKYGGFAQKSVGDMIEYYEVSDGEATYNSDKIASDNLTTAWVEVRTTRNQLLDESDWRAMSDLTMSDGWTTYRQALRDVGGQADPANITWPTKPS